jgi:signal transduction histidine kinase
VKRFQLIVIFSSLLLLPSGCSRHSGRFKIEVNTPPDELPYTLETMGGLFSKEPNHPFKLLFDDLNGDGNSEEIYWYNYSSAPGKVRGTLVYYENPVGDQILWQDNYNTGCEIKDVAAFDLNGDGKKEIFASEVCGDSVLIRITDLTKKLIGEFTVAVGKGLGPKQAWELHVYTLGVCDLNGDGYADLIYTLDAKPDSSVQRAVVAYDVRRGKEIWRYHIAGHVTPPIFRIVHLPDSKTPVIVFAINSYANGYADNDMDDFHSYVVGLDFHGKELWRHIVGGAFCMPTFLCADIDYDGKPEILVGQSSYGATADSFQILCYDAVTGNPKFASPKFASGIIDLKLDQGNNLHKRSIIACLNDGRLVMLNSQLKVLGVSDTTKIWRVCSVDHLLKDQTSLWLCSTRDGQLLVFDNAWRLLAMYQGALFLSAPYDPVITKDGRKAILVDTERGSGPIYLLKKNPLAVLSAKYKWWVIWVTLLLVIVYIVTIGIRSFKNMYLSLSSLPSLDKLQVGVIVLNEKGRVLFSNNNPVIKELVRGGKTLRADYRELFGRPASSVAEIIQTSYENFLLPYEGEIQLKLGEADRRLWVSIFPKIDNNNRFKGKVVTIEDLTNKPDWKRTVVLGEAAQKWIHSLKARIATAKLAVENLQQSAFYTEVHHQGPLNAYLQDIKTELNESSETATKILRFLRVGEPNLAPCDIAQVIRTSLTRLHGYRMKKIEMEIRLQQDLPLIYGDALQLAEALDNLFMNAIHAMEEGGKLSVTAELASKLHTKEGVVSEKAQDYVRIEITDTGCGILKEDIDKIFEPGFSKSKSGTGIGLAIAREIVIRHKGKIKVKSEPGVETTFTVFLPVG